MGSIIYLSGEVKSIPVFGDIDIRPLPGVVYEDITLHFQPGNKLIYISPSIALKSTFNLPNDQYTYIFNPEKEVIEVHNSNGVIITELSLDENLRTSPVQINGGEPVVIEYDEQNNEVSDGPSQEPELTPVPGPTPPSFSVSIDGEETNLNFKFNNPTIPVVLTIEEGKVVFTDNNGNGIKRNTNKELADVAEGGIPAVAMNVVTALTADLADKLSAYSIDDTAEAIQALFVTADSEANEGTEALAAHKILTGAQAYTINDADTVDFNDPGINLAQAVVLMGAENYRADSPAFEFSLSDNNFTDPGITLAQAAVLMAANNFDDQLEAFHFSIQDSAMAIVTAEDTLLSKAQKVTVTGTVTEDTDLTEISQTLVFDELLTVDEDVTLTLDASKIDFNQFTKIGGEGDVVMNVAADQTLTLTAAQADGMTISGAGNVTLTRSESTDAKQLNILTTGKNTIEAGPGANQIALGENTGSDTLVFKSGEVTANPSTAVFDITDSQAQNDAALFSMTIGDVQVTDFNVSSATGGADLASKIQTELRNQDNHSEAISVTWESNKLTVKDEGFRAISSESLMKAARPEELLLTMSDSQTSDQNSALIAIKINGLSENWHFGYIASANTVEGLASNLQKKGTDDWGWDNVTVSAGNRNGTDYLIIADSLSRGFNAFDSRPLIQFSNSNNDVQADWWLSGSNVQLLKGSQAGEIDNQIAVTQGSLTIENSDSMVNAYDVVTGFSAANDKLELDTIDLLSDGNYNPNNIDFNIKDGIANFTGDALSLEQKFEAVFTAMQDSKTLAAFEHTSDDITSTFVLAGDGRAGVLNSDIIIKLDGVSGVTSLNSILSNYVYTRADVQALLDQNVTLDSITYKLAEGEQALGEQSFAAIENLVAIVAGSSNFTSADVTVSLSSQDATFVNVNSVLNYGVTLDRITYNLSGTWEEISNPDNAELVGGAQAYTITDATQENFNSLTLTQAALLRGADNYDANNATFNYTLAEGLQQLGTQDFNVAEGLVVIVAGSTNYEADNITLTLSGNSTRANVQALLDKGVVLGNITYTLANGQQALGDQNLDHFDDGLVDIVVGSENFTIADVTVTLNGSLARTQVQQFLDDKGIPLGNLTYTLASGQEELTPLNIADIGNIADPFGIIAGSTDFTAGDVKLTITDPVSIANIENLLSLYEGIQLSHITYDLIDAEQAKVFGEITYEEYSARLPIVAQATNVEKTAITATITDVGSALNQTIDLDIGQGTLVYVAEPEFAGNTVSITGFTAGNGISTDLLDISNLGFSGTIHEVAHHASGTAGMTILNDKDIILITDMKDYFAGTAEDSLVVPHYMKDHRGYLTQNDDSHSYFVAVSDDESNVYYLYTVEGTAVDDPDNNPPGSVGYHFGDLVKVGTITTTEDLAPGNFSFTITADGTAEVEATNATDTFLFSAISNDNFTTINGLELGDRLNVLSADSSAAGNYHMNAVDTLDVLTSAGQWYFDDLSNVLSYWDASAEGTATVTLTGVTSLTADANGVFTIL